MYEQFDQTTFIQVANELQPRFTFSISCFNSLQ